MLCTSFLPDNANTCTHRCGSTADNCPSQALLHFRGSANAVLDQSVLQWHKRPLQGWLLDMNVCAAFLKSSCS